MLKVNKKLLAINLLVFISILISLELAAGYIRTFKQVKKSSIYHLINKLKTEGSSTKEMFNKMNELKEKGYKRVYPDYLYDPQAHAINSNKYWLTNLPNSTIVYCKESSGLAVFKTNRLGLRKVHNQNLESPIDLFVLGDSYTEGACVNSPNDIPSQLSLIRKENVLNAGVGGSGPLYQLALLKEIINYSKQNGISFNKNAKLVWILFTGNDLKNIAEEKVSLLSHYLESDFNIDYFNKLNQSIESRESFLKKIINNYGLNRKIGSHGYGESVTPNSISEMNALNDLSRIFSEVNEISKNNNLSLNIIILSDHPLYDKGLMKSTQNRLRNLCKESKCLSLDLSVIRQNDRISHVTEKDYKNIAESISDFIGN